MAFSLARRLRAGETVYSGWSSLPAPIIVEVLARSGFSAVAIDMQHGMWDFAAAVTGIGAITGAGAAPDRAHPLSRLADGEPRARHGRRGRRGAADQHRRRRQAIRIRRQVSAARRPQLGPEPRHDARRFPRHEILFARRKRHDRHHRHDRDARGAQEPRCDRRGRRYRCAVRRPLRPLHHHDRRRGSRSAIERGRGRSSTRSPRRRRRRARWPAFIARPANARRRWPSAASAISPSATTSAFCARASPRTRRR